MVSGATDEVFYSMYASKAIEAIDALCINYRNLPLHNRLAIILPDKDFRDKLMPYLSGALLKSDNYSKFKLKSAQEVSGVILGGINPDDDDICSILFDYVDEMDGLERLIVICIGLDKNICEDGDIGDTRCVLYRAMSRALMQVTVINHIITGGWFAHLTKLKPVEKDVQFDQEKAKQMMDFKLAQQTVLNNLQVVFPFIFDVCFLFSVLFSFMILSNLCCFHFRAMNFLGEQMIPKH
jgi:hypothetical protein